MKTSTLYRHFALASGLAMSACSVTSVGYDYAMHLNDKPLIYGILSGETRPYCVVTDDDDTHLGLGLPACEGVDLSDFHSIQTPVAPINGHQMRPIIDFYYQGKKI